MSHPLTKDDLFDVYLTLESSYFFSSCFLLNIFILWELSNRKDKPINRYFQFCFLSFVPRNIRWLSAPTSTCYGKNHDCRFQKDFFESSITRWPPPRPWSPSTSSSSTTSGCPTSSSTISKLSKWEFLKFVFVLKVEGNFCGVFSK